MGVETLPAARRVDVMDIDPLWFQPLECGGEGDVVYKRKLMGGG